MRQGDQLQTFFFLKYAQYEVKASGLKLSFNIFQQPSTQDSIKINCIKFQAIDSEISEKGLGLASPPHFVYDFQEKCFSCYILFTDHTSLSIAFTSRDIGQYVYYNCLLTRLCVIKFEINLIFLIKLFCYMTEKLRQKFK